MNYLLLDNQHHHIAMIAPITWGKLQIGVMVVFRDKTLPPLSILCDKMRK